MPWLLVVAVVGAVAYALGSSNRPPERISAAPAAPVPPAAGSDEEPGQGAPGGPSSDALETVTGVVREHSDVSQYTYVRLGTDAGETWAAVYRAPVKDGSTITVEHASAIHNFHSRELKRDFETIWFGMLPGYETAPATGNGSGNANGMGSGNAGGSGNGNGAGAGTPVPRPAGAISIADLAKKAQSLEGQPVTVTGNVVKVNDGILGRNWIHVQDGTGNAGDKTNDVLVTTDATAKVGDKIVATGTVKTKQDFGSGYAYDFMLEKATVSPAATPPGH
jgi:hypothetical protein